MSTKEKFKAVGIALVGAISIYVILFLGAVADKL